MRRLNAHIEGFRLKQQYRDEEMWAQGQYNLSAFQTALSHLAAGFSKRRSDAKYVEKPFSRMLAEEKEAETMTEEEKIAYTENFFKALSVMQANFELENGMES